MMPLALFECSAVFIPEGEEDDDNLDFTRGASNVRPLYLNTTDNKIVCAANNEDLKVFASQNISHIQRGFIFGRQAGPSS